MRGKERCVTGWSNVISRFLRHPSILFKLPTMLQTKHAKKRGTEDENRGRGRVSIFHPFNNVGMISAYPLITSLLFSSPPRSLLSLVSCKPSFFSSGERKSSLFLSPASLFCRLSVCLSFQSSLHRPPLSREGILLYSTDLLLSSPSFLQPTSFFHFSSQSVFFPFCLDS